MKILCDIYKGNKDEEMFLYVKKEDGLKKVPELLLQKLGSTRQVMSIVLTPGKKLARANSEKVIEQLEKEGYYLQMPPSLYVVK
ncbi:hypothetical protein NBRC116493_25910 [Aurantivibrio infirmus]